MLQKRLWWQPDPLLATGDTRMAESPETGTCAEVGEVGGGVVPMSEQTCPKATAPLWLPHS